jgi:hypothetical protein
MKMIAKSQSLLFLLLLQVSLASTATTATGISKSVRVKDDPTKINCFQNFFGRRKHLKPLLVLSLRGGSRKHKFSTWSEDVIQPLGSDVSFSINRTGDGSEDDPDGIPTRYLVAHKQNREKALKAFHKTCKWREDHGIGTLLSNKVENFHKCREIFPVFIPGRDPEGHLIVVQRPGQVDLRKAKEENISEEEILKAYIYMVEYCWNLLDPSPLPPNGLMTTILDCHGTSFANFKNKEYRSFGKKLVKIMSDHYPTRGYKTLVINAPKWIKMAFNFVKPLIRESTRKKIVILNSGPEQDRILKEVLGGEDLPAYLLRENSKEEVENVKPSEIEKEMRLLASVGLNQL